MDFDPSRRDVLRNDCQIHCKAISHLHPTAKPSVAEKNQQLERQN